MRTRNARYVSRLLAASALAGLAQSAHGQQFTIVNDTFLDSGSPGTVNPATGQTNAPTSMAIVNGQDIYSYGADGKVKAVTSSYSSSYPFVSATHVLFQLPPSFWTQIGNQDVVSAVVNYYPLNDSLSVADTHDNMELHPLTQPFIFPALNIGVGNGTQSPLKASSTGGATWDSYDGAVADAWTTPGGTFDAANFAISTATDSTLPASKGSTPFSWNITSLINNPTTRAELQNNGALLKVLNEGVFPNNPSPPNGENDFVSFYSADYEVAMGTTNPAFLPNVAVTAPQPTALTWNNAGGAGDGKTWDITTNPNWNNGGATVYSQSNNVTFNDANNGNYNVTIPLNTTVTPGTVLFANFTGNYTVGGAGGIGGAASVYATGSGTVTISTSNSYSGSTSVIDGTLIIGAAAALPRSTAVTVSSGSMPAKMQLAPGIGQATVASLTINAGGTLDITNNTLAIDFSGPGTDPAAAVRGYLESGYANDAWTGPGIDSSKAAANPGLFAVGYADGNTDIGTPAAANQLLARFTLAGDANLDGVVNFPDLLVVAQNYGKSGMDWAQGDFNYDGIVNFPDLLLIAQNYGKQLSTQQLEELPGSFSAAWQLAETEISVAGTSSVPEPTAAALMSLVGVGLLARRREGKLRAT